MTFGVDALVIYLAARDESLFWIYPLLATAGSLAAAAFVFWAGHKAGEVGLDRFVSRKRLEGLRRRVRNSGAVALALPAILPPPFPLTPFVLTCGALHVNRVRFFSTFGGLRLLRFSLGATLAHIYGDGILRVLRSDTFQMVVVGFVAVAIVGTILSALLFWRNAHARPLSAA